MEPSTQHKDLFSKLAHEVLGDIFVYCLPPETEPISSKSGPLLLVQVCHRWREVAFGTPSLWQNIRLERIWPECRIFVLDLFVTKSGNLPLTITYPLGLGGYSEGNKVLVNRLLDNFHRVLSWKGRATSLFSYFDFKCPSALGTPHHIHATLLKHLSLTGLARPPKITEVMTRKYAHNLIIAPNLEELHLDGSGFSFSIVHFSPESLRVLTGLFINEVAQICDMSFLCKTINLVTLEFRAYNRHEDVDFNFPSSVYLPNLKCLRMLIVGVHFVEKIISPLRCPAIEELVLNIRPDDTPFPNVIECLAKGQTPPLRSLSTNIFPGTPLSSYYSFNDVKELTLLFDLGEPTIQTLMEKEGCEFRLFPQLSSLTIQDTIFESGETDSVLTILKTRCIMASGGTLTYAKFQDCIFQAGDRDNIRALQKELEGKLTIDILDGSRY